MQNSGGATLLFPAVGQAATDYLIAARERAETVVRAASVANLEMSADWGECHRLPSIYDADFESSFASLVQQFNVARVYCPVSSVHDFMRRYIGQGKSNLKLLGVSPIQQQMDSHRRLMQRASALWPFIRSTAAQGEPIRLIEWAGILRQAALIYGESNDDKLAALAGVFSTAPKGDVIEIGSLMGRSAFVLIYLAWRYSVGAVLTVDPWQPFAAVQKDSPLEFQALVDEWDFEVLSEGFAVNMVPMRTLDHAHIRAQSAEGYRKYAAGETILSISGEPVEYERRVAVIHIDGNHDYSSVREDCELWLTRLVPGAWLILDDYIWAHGDGPYRMGNELLRDEVDRIERAFVSGKALFVKFH